VIAAMCEKAGVILNVMTQIRFAETACGFVAKGMGLAIVDALTAADAGYAGLVVRPLTDTGALSVYAHRNTLTPNSKIGAAFEGLAERILRPATG
jgi:DNA-binding transcriptional LysR family regulator